MNGYFRTCKTAEEGKQLYRKLAKELHPDSPTGNEEQFKQLQKEFEIFWTTHKDTHFSQKTGQRYTSEKATTERASDFMEIIEYLSHMDGIDAEICGEWIWIDGNTYPHRGTLKDIGCRWSNSKKKWYWCHEYRSIHYKGNNSMKYIRAKYGSEKIQFSSRLVLE